MAKTAKTMIPENLVKRLINTYTECIVTDSDGELDFEETIYNFSKKIVDDMGGSQQKSVFGVVFDGYDDCYDYLENKVPSLRHELEVFLFE